MNLRKLLLTKNACYKAGKKITVKGIMVHSTAANNPKLSRYVGPDDGLLGVNPNGNHWNTDKPEGRQTCVHGFIGKLKDGNIATYQTLPWDMRGWHAGGKANDTHIGFELCEDAIDPKKAECKEYFAKGSPSRKHVHPYMTGYSKDNIAELAESLIPSTDTDAFVAGVNTGTLIWRIDDTKFQTILGY